MVLAPLLRFLERNFLRKSLVKSERSDRFQQGNTLKIIEHASYSIRYCKISLLYLQGTLAFQIPRLFFLTHPARHYITLHFVRYTTINTHTTTIHYEILRCITLQYTTLHYITIHLHYTTLHYINLSHNTLYCNTL